MYTFSLLKIESECSSEDCVGVALHGQAWLDGCKHAAQLVHMALPCIARPSRPTPLPTESHRDVEDEDEMIDFLGIDD